MIRKKRPYKFSVGGENFKTTRLGFLTTAELLAKYAPIILSLQSNLAGVDVDGEGDGVDLSEVLKGIPKNTITNICEELLDKTYVEDPDNEGSYELVNGEDFESFKEMIAIAVEVFKYNFPDFSMGGDDTEDEVLEQAPTIQKTKPSVNPQKIVQL
jgi:hypothetical protein